MEAPAPPSAVSIGQPVNNPGLKFLIVCALALIMAVPAVMVFALLGDRTHRAEQVAEQLGGVLGGPQTFAGPIIALPYTERAPRPATPPDQPTPAAPANATRSSVLFLFPDQAQAAITEHSEVRQRSLFKVPVYRASLQLGAHFQIPDLVLPPGASVDWSRAELLVGASEPRGAQTDAVVTVNGQTLPLAPASLIGETNLEAPGDTNNNAAVTRPLRFFGAPGAALVGPGKTLDASAKLAFSGAKRLSVLAYGRTTTLTVYGDWPHPSFDGGFLPVKRTITDKGFSGEWSVPFIARGAPGWVLADTLPRLGRAEMGVSFAQPADPYQSVARSLKYALLFVGLVFLTYFIFEMITGLAVHPAQYLLVGLAQIVFYLLLLSVAEHTGFDWAFLLAAGATVGLIGGYAGSVFRSRTRGAQALVTFGVLYAGIYVLMRLEDYALLVGAVAAFAAIAAVMFFTRRVDWYGAGRSLVDAARSRPDPSPEAR